MVKDSVYEMIGKGLFRVLLISCIGVLTVGKFGALPMFQIQPDQIKWLWSYNSVEALMEAAKVASESSPIIFWPIAAMLYGMLGLIGWPGQSAFHVFAGYCFGVVVSTPVVALTSTVTAMITYVLSRHHATSENASPILMYYSAKLDVLIMQVAQAKYKAELADSGKKSEDKMAEEDWAEWAQWNTARFFYLLWARFFPFSQCASLNITAGVQHKMVPFREYFLATLLGNFPYVFALVKYGSVMKTFYVSSLLDNSVVKGGTLVLIMLMPYFVNKSKILESDLIPRNEFGMELQRQKKLKQALEEREARKLELDNKSD